MMSTDHARAGRFRGPLCWALSALAGLLLGALLTRLLPIEYGAAGDAAHGPAPRIPILLCVPFALLLASIAVMPLARPRFWHDHFPDVAFFFGSIAVGFYLVGFARPGYSHGMSYGQYQLLHTAVEYYSFIALVGGLYVVSGGVLIEVRGRGGPIANTLLLAAGAVIANVVGTTGASMLLIRPYMRLNAGRLRPMHVVFFIFIVSNCGGCLTPIGDPPLYLGFLKGIPFAWTIEHLWPDWLLVNGLLLGVFAAYDARLGKRAAAAGAPGHAVAGDRPARGLPIRVRGMTSIVCLGGMIFCVFLDPILKATASIQGFPFGATAQVGIAALAWRLTPKPIHHANQFTFFPVKEVGLLFLGIFAAMTPALGYLASEGDALGIRTATQFYFGTGTLSAMLDNAPTYANFLQVAYGPHEMTRDGLAEFLARPEGRQLVHAVSVGAVFFGAATYIGNGPNFMVKAIADASGLRMPSFFGYLARAVAILFPVLVVEWAVLIR